MQPSTVAPTHKIVDGGPSQPVSHPSSRDMGGGRGGGENALAHAATPRSGPIHAVAPASPMQGYAVRSSARAISASAAAPGASRSRSEDAPVAARGTRWGVVGVVLAIDLALAAAGAWMLREGMSARATTGSAAPSPSRASTP